MGIWGCWPLTRPAPHTFSLTSLRYNTLMQKLIVTHKSVDLDAVTSVWLIKRFYPHFKDADIAFVNAGSTYEDKPVDSDEHIIHVDTGFGRFDHHQSDTFTCAAQKIYLWLKEHTTLKPVMQKGLERITNFVTDIDHFREVYFPDPTNDVYTFSLVELIEGLKHVSQNDLQVMDLSFKLLDASLQLITNKIRAEEELEKGYAFTTKYGKTLAIESKNEEVMKLAMKMGYQLVIRKDPQRGNIRIKTFPDKKNDLTPVYEAILKKDKKGDWFLHVGKKMLLNGSSKNPALKPSSLTLKQVIQIVKKV